MTTANVEGSSNFEPPERRYANIVDSMRLFDAQIPNEDSARRSLFAALAEDRGIRCGGCGTFGMPGQDSKRFFVCRGCKRNVWITANTFFENVRRVRPWLAMTWLMEHGIPFNPYQIHELLCVSSSTAAEMKHKLDYLISEQMTADSPKAPTAVFTALFCRRTTETPARKHPREEQVEIERAKSVASDQFDQAPSVVQEEEQSDSSLEAMEECEKAVWDCLSEEFVSFDLLACRSGLPVSVISAGVCLLKLRGVINETNGRFARVHKTVSQNFDANKVLIENFKIFIKRIHQGVGRRKIQWYLASFWCFVDRQRWGPGNVLAVCMRARAVKLDDLRRYVSPAYVKVLPRVG